jgi:ubiquinone/menaquinone biosynthesis C-methylase UbiE
MEKSTIFLFNSAPTLAEEFSKYVPRNSRILDFGCGRGMISCSLALRGFEVHGVDISNEALDVAKKLNDKLRCKVTFYRIERSELPFAHGYFDAVFSHWTFHEIQQDQQPKAVAEFYRTLKDKGYVFIIDQEEVASFKTVKNLMDQHKFHFESEKSLSQVYDHGKVSQAIMLTYRKGPE